MVVLLFALDLRVDAWVLCLCFMLTGLQRALPLLWEWLHTVCMSKRHRIATFKSNAAKNAAHFAWESAFVARGYASFFVDAGKPSDMKPCTSLVGELKLPRTRFCQPQTKIEVMSDGSWVVRLNFSDVSLSWVLHPVRAQRMLSQSE
jgi:hypothetical protein